MNYIHQVLGFYDFQLSNPLSTGQIALWHALMHINNKCAWIEWFTAPNRTLELTTGLSRQGIYNARNELRQLGVIDFNSNGTRASSYKLIKLYPLEKSSALQDILQDTLQPALQGTLQGTLQDPLQTTCTLNKQNKTKQNSSNSSKGREKKKFEVNPEIRSVLKYYEENISTISSSVSEDIFYFIQTAGISGEVVTKAIEEAINQNVRKWSYVKGILNNCMQNRILTINQWNNQKRDWKEAKSGAGYNSENNGANASRGAGSSAPRFGYVAGSNSTEEM